MSDATLFDRWTPEQEQMRVSTRAAGLTPSLHRYWVGHPTSELQACLDEYRPHAVELDLVETVADLEAEIAYRSGT